MDKIKEFLTRNYKLSCAVSMGIIVLIQVIQMIAQSSRFSTYFAVDTLGMACLIVYLYVFEGKGKKNWAILPAAGFALIAVKNVVAFINFCKAVSTMTGFYVAYSIFSLIVRPVMFALLILLAYMTLTAYDFKLGPIDSKKTVLIYAAITVVGTLFFLVTSLVCKYDNAILNCILSLILNVCEFIVYYLFVENAKVEKVSFLK